MPTVKISKLMLENLRFSLSRRGIQTDGLPATRIVSLSLERFIEEGNPPEREAPLLGEGHQSPSPPLDVRGQVAAFAAKYDWTQTREDRSGLKPELRRALLSAEAEVQQECLYEHEGAEILCEEPPEREQGSFSFPPWQGLKRLTFKEIQFRNPRHKLLLEAIKGDVQQLAVECAFGTLPADLHSEQKVFLLYREFLQMFEAYIQESGCKLVLKEKGELDAEGNKTK